MIDMRNKTMFVWLALALLALVSPAAAGASALDGYEYYQMIEYAACDQETYQQDIVVHRTTGTAYEETVGPLRIWHIYVGDHCRADYGDVRFTDSTGAELAYYLWPDYSSESAQFTVRLEGADAAGVTQIHYGNPTATTTTSDGDAVYILFDQFDGAALDASKWDVVVSSHTVSGGVLRVTKPGSSEAGYIYSKQAIKYPIIVQSQGRATDPSVTGPTPIGIKTKDTNWNYRAGTVFTSPAGYTLRSRWGEGNTQDLVISGLEVTTFRTFTLDWIGTSIGIAIDGTHYGYNTQYVYTADQYVVFYGGDTVGSVVEVDWVVVRTYSATPPAAITFSGERETASPPATAFTATPITGRAPLTVQFTDLSGGLPTSWHWDFGDGTTSNDRNPTHTYTKPGIYTVALTVSNAYGKVTETKAGLITVLGSVDAISPPDLGNYDLRNGTYTQYWLDFSNGFPVYGLIYAICLPFINIFGYWFFAMLWFLYLGLSYMRTGDVTLPLTVGLISGAVWGVIMPPETFIVGYVMLATSIVAILMKLFLRDRL